MREATDLRLMNHLDELAAFKPTEFPFISLYLNMQPDQHGRDNFESFVRKEFKTKVKSFTPDSLELYSFKQDSARIQNYLRKEVRPSANGLAIFACAGADNYFRTMQLDAPIQQHRLHVGQGPHLYPLARLIDQYPRYVALVADTNSARLFVFGMASILNKQGLQQEKLSRTQIEGWSQMRYQRHVDNYQLHHAKEVVEMLERVMREERAEHIVLAGDEVIIPLLHAQLPEWLKDKIVDILRLDIRTPEHEVLKVTMEALQAHNLHSDADRVRHLLDEYRAGGLAVVTVDDTVKALDQGQVDELLITASSRAIQVDNWPAEDTEFGSESPDQNPSTADLLVRRARQTGARITFIEDPALLSGVGGVGAILRYGV